MRHHLGDVILWSTFVAYFLALYGSTLINQ